MVTSSCQAYALKEYARQRDDKELECKMAEIRLRAEIRIGQISRTLEKAQGARTELHPTYAKKSKEAQLAEAGISTSAANRYEQLVVPSEKEGTTMVFFSAMEAYFAETEAKQEPPNNRGLMKFTREKLKEAGNEHMLKPTTRPKREFKEPDPDLDYVRLWGTV